MRAGCAASIESSNGAVIVHTLQSEQDVDVMPSILRVIELDAASAFALQSPSPIPTRR